MRRLFLSLMATVAAAGAATVLAACGSSTGLHGGSGASDGSGSGMSAMSTDPAAGAGGSGSMSAMQMGAPTASAEHLIAAHSLGSADWQEMKIQAATAAPSSLDLATGAGSDTVLAPPRHASFQLQVLLTDARTNVAVPYARVSARILSSTGKVVFGGYLLPVLSSTLGSDYADNVGLLHAGRYTLALTIVPPVAARHLEYSHVWMHPHLVTIHFSWPHSR